MNEIFEDSIWEVPAAARCVLTSMVCKNGELIMGAGQAKHANKVYPGLAKQFGHLILSGHRVFEVLISGDTAGPDRTLSMTSGEHSELVICLPTRFSYKDKWDLDFIGESLRQLVYLANNPSWTRSFIKQTGLPITLMRPGDPNDWYGRTGALCSALLDDRFTIVHPWKS